jgi:hypothetical protein
MTEKQLKRGDIVTWTSQAAGASKAKTGEIVEVVAAGARPPGKGWGWARDHESYLVRVPVGKRTRLYWPRASRLELAVGPEQQHLPAIRSPIERLIGDSANLRCTICGAKAFTCTCWTRCHCGWWFETKLGEADCRNPVHEKKRAQCSKGTTK